MPARKPPSPDEKPQFERLIETARQIGAAETDDALERTIEKIARPVIPPTSPRESRKSLARDPKA